MAACPGSRFAPFLKGDGRHHAGNGSSLLSDRVGGKPCIDGSFRWLEEVVMRDVVVLGGMGGMGGMGR
jgi:hypothetical protein